MKDCEDLLAPPATAPTSAAAPESVRVADASSLPSDKAMAVRKELARLAKEIAAARKEIAKPSQRAREQRRSEALARRWAGNSRKFMRWYGSKETPSAPRRSLSRGPANPSLQQAIGTRPTQPPPSRHSPVTEQTRETQRRREDARYMAPPSPVTAPEWDEEGKTRLLGGSAILTAALERAVDQQVADTQAALEDARPRPSRR